MPFDGSAYTVSRIATKDEFWAATPRQRLAMTAYALRHLPDTHFWDFRSPSSCAYGLAGGLWGGCKAWNALDEAVGYEWCCSIFNNFGGHYRYADGTKTRLRDVTPEMVADAIDRYLLTGDPSP